MEGELPRTPVVNLGTNVGEVASIQAGGSTTCAVFESGLLKCWGRNNEGSLGIGVDASVYFASETIGVSAWPVAVEPSLPRLRSLSAVSDHVARGACAAQWLEPPLYRVGDNTNEMGNALSYINVSCGAPRQFVI